MASRNDETGLIKMASRKDETSLNKMASREDETSLNKMASRRFPPFFFFRVPGSFTREKIIVRGLLLRTPLNENKKGIFFFFLVRRGTNKFHRFE